MIDSRSIDPQDYEDAPEEWQTADDQLAKMIEDYAAAADALEFEQDELPFLTRTTGRAT